MQLSSCLLFSTCQQVLNVKASQCINKGHMLLSACVCVPIFTAGEDEGTGVFVHREIMELQLAFGVDGHPGEEETSGQRELKH